MKYIIYCIKNKVNNKVYVGYTTQTIEKRFNDHIRNAKNKLNRRLYDSMNYHGYNNFEIKKIDECDIKVKAEELESWYIYLFNSKNPNSGYNMTWGGDGGNTISEWSDERKKILYEKQKKNREKTLLEKYGVNSPTKIESVKNKISESHKGKSLTQEHKNSISETIKNKLKSGEFVPNKSGLRPHIKGEFKHTEETKKKIGEFRFGKKYENIFNEEMVKKLKENKSKNWKGIKNPNYKPSLSYDETKIFIQLLIDNKKMSECELILNHSQYKLRQFLRTIGITNIQKLKNTDKKNIFLKKILENI